MNNNQEIKVMRKQPAEAIQWLGDLDNYFAVANFLRPRVSYAMYDKGGIRNILSMAYTDKSGNHNIEVPSGTWLVFEDGILQFFDPEKFESVFRLYDRIEIREETDSIMATELARKLNAAVEDCGDHPVINSLTMPVLGGDGFSYVVYHRGDDHFELE